LARGPDGKTRQTGDYRPNAPDLERHLLSN
jgi:hypothetical protein